MRNFNIKIYYYFLFVLTAITILSCSTTKEINRPFDDEIHIDYNTNTNDNENYIVEDNNKDVTKFFDEYYENFYDKEQISKTDTNETKELNTLDNKIIDNFNSSIVGEKNHNFSNSIVEYSFIDGKVYTLLIGTNMITDLRLESGEELTGDIAIADQLSYIIDVVYSVENGNNIIHILIRALNTDSWTTMILTTNLRTYYFKLVPTDKIGMFGVKFKYKNSNLKPSTRKINNNVLTNLKNLYFDYNIYGHKDLKPAAVFSDSKKTYIQFSKNFYSNDINPALYIEDPSGLSIINYTIHGNMYVVDFILDNNETFVLMVEKKKAYIKKN